MSAQQPAPQQPQQPKQKKRHLGCLITLSVIVVIILIVIIASCSSSGQTSKTSSPPAATGTQQTTTAASPASAAAPTRDNSTAKAVTLGAGSWSVGSDIQPGRYAITTPSGSGNISSGDGSLNEILDASGTEGVKSVTTDLKSGETIQIQELNSVVFTPAQTHLSTTLGAGTWTVGLDIPAGTYNASAPSGSGNFVVDDKDGLSSTNEILDASGSTGVKSVHVNLTNGQTVNISSLNQVNFTQG